MDGCLHQIDVMLGIHLSKHLPVDVNVPTKNFDALLKRVGLYVLVLWLNPKSLPWLLLQRATANHPVYSPSGDCFGSTDGVERARPTTERNSSTE